MGKAGKKGGKRMTKKELVKVLTGLFRKNPQEEFSSKQIFQALHLTTHPAKMLCLDLLSDLTLDDYIHEVSRDRYRYHDFGQIMEGTFQRKKSGQNLFQPDDGSEPVVVAERNAARALNGDRVKVSLFAKRRRGQKEGEVIEIIERTKDTIVGTLRVEKHYAFLITEDRTFANDIFIPKGKLKNGETGDKVVARIVEWPDDAKSPIGEVIDVLGQSGENNTEMHAILAEFGLPYRYPLNVEKAAEKISEEIPAEEIARREDFRGVPTFTIDPHDAKDFDDALSIRKLKENLWEVGVHIADVTHYIKEGDIIDKEAFRRATSVYLVDRTIPMLPERLCNKLCSLRPDEDKLAYSVIFTINQKAEVKSHRVVHTVIRSQRRFTYEEAQEIIEKGRPIPSLAEGAGVGLQFQEELLCLNTLAQILREKRFANGAIDFDRMEVRFDIDEKGKPVSIYFKESKEANKLIEEFMLLANRTVAEDIGRVPKNRKAKVFPYRIHDMPDREKLDDMKKFVSRFGYKLRTGSTKGETSRGINRLLAEVKGKAEQNLVELISLRAMQKAKYSTHNIGHYGLAFDYYTHFTSPIRRYPDMMVHRLLTRYLDGGRSVTEAKYEEMCEHASAMEQIASNAERTSVKYKQVEFMSEHIGKVYDGIISGISDWGLYVELNENKCEGMISLRDLGGDYFEFDERNYRLVGHRTGKCYNLCDPIQIKVAHADLEKKQLHFVLAVEPQPVTFDYSYSGRNRGRGRRRFR